MDSSSIFTSLLALAFVLGLIGLVSVALRRFGPERMLYGMQKKRGAEKRLKIEETLMLDARRRLVLLKCDDTEHLVLLGATNEQVVALPKAASLKRKKPNA